MKFTRKRNLLYGELNLNGDQEIDKKALRELYESEKDQIDKWAKDEKSTSHLLAKLMKECVAENDDAEKKSLKSKISQLLKRFKVKF